jgi:phosphomannomutase
MALMISVAGIRGIVGTDLTPESLTKYVAAYGSWLRQQNPTVKNKVVIGRDTRPTGKVISDLAVSVLLATGLDVVDIGVVTTPTVEMAVTNEKAQGGIIITASHNPVEWNAFKFLNAEGEFLSDAQGKAVIAIAESKNFSSAKWNEFGTRTEIDWYLDYHIQKILSLPFIDTNQIASKRYKVVADCVNGAGSEVVPRLLKALGIADVIEVACDGTGIFPRNPEPNEENLKSSLDVVHQHQADFGVVVDPDVDRLAIISEDGTLFGEEYTLAVAARFLLDIKNLSHADVHQTSVVNNLSSSLVLRDIAEDFGVQYFSAKVGEANVVKVMKEKNAIIGGEGNGGVILPELHYGRDALVGIAMFVQAMSNFVGTASAFKHSFPQYYISKHKLELSALIAKGFDADAILARLQTQYATDHSATLDVQDGLKITFEKSWVHLRKSNTEPIIRIYAEAQTPEEADGLARKFIAQIEQFATAA